MSRRRPLRRYGELLTEAIAECQEFPTAASIARKVLEHDGGSSLLIGVVGQGATVITYDLAVRAVHQTRYEVDDVHTPRLRRRELETVQSIHDVEELLREGTIAAEWVWLHPRWRWMVEY